MNHKETALKIIAPWPNICMECDEENLLENIEHALALVERKTLERAYDELSGYFFQEPDAEWEGSCITNKIQTLKYEALESFQVGDQ